MVDRILSQDVFVMEQVNPSFTRFEKDAAYPVTKCVRLGKTLRKSYALDLDDEELAYVDFRNNI